MDDRASPTDPWNSGADMADDTLQMTETKETMVVGEREPPPESPELPDRNVFMAVVVSSHGEVEPPSPLAVESKRGNEKQMKEGAIMGLQGIDQIFNLLGQAQININLLGGAFRVWDEIEGGRPEQSFSASAIGQSNCKLRAGPGSSTDTVFSAEGDGSSIEKLFWLPSRLTEPTPPPPEPLDRGSHTVAAIAPCRGL